MRIQFLGADHEVTGSCHYIQVGGKHILIDCGMKQGPDLYVNQDIPVNASLIDYVFITHAHIDHSGNLPLLYSRGFRGEIYATEATTELCRIMLKDSAHIQMQEAEWKNRKARRAGLPEVTPIYSIDDAEGVLKHFVPVKYNRKCEVCDEVTIRFIDAGHLLGSSSIEIWAKEDNNERKLVFSGDIGNGNHPLIKDPEYIRDADYVIMESTYGDKEHAAVLDYASMLAEAISDAFARGGNLVIPAFSVGRTQELLYFMRRIKTENLLPQFPDFEVYIDSPMAIEATKVFHESVSECFDDEAMALVNKGINPLAFPGLKTAVTSDESRMINFLDHPVVIISASGMCEAGRIRHHLKHNLWRRDSTVMFVGFQVPGTLGHALLNDAKEVRLFGETIEVFAKIMNMPGISGHADREHLLKWINAFEQKPKKVFVVHGDDEVCESFADALRKTGFDAVPPYSGDGFDLATGEQIFYGDRRKLEKKQRTSKAASNIFARLIAAGERLVAVIAKSEGRPNKELGALADQINAMCDKWEK